MRGPVIDLVLLALLILFFGIQQRGRHQRHFQLWFLGWAVVFISLIVWEPAARSFWLSLLQQAIQFDLLMLGTMLFILSFAPRQLPLRRLAWLGAACYLPAAVGVTLQQLTPVPVAVVMAIILCGEAIGILVALTLIDPRRRTERAWLIALCLLFAVVMNVTVLQSPEFLPDLAVAQLLMAAGILYAGASEGPLPVRLAGSMGFLMWGVFHAALGWLESAGSSRSMLTLGQLWSIPKYTVAFAMILEIFESQRAEVARLASGYRELYDDFRLLYERHPHPMWIHDAASRQILSANAAAATAYGYAMDELLRMSVTQLEVAAVVPSHALPGSPSTPPANALPTGGTASLARHRCHDGHLVTVELSERGILFQGREARVVLAVDVTQKERETRELVHRAHHDVLTGLPNRALIDLRMQECLARSAEEGHRAAIVTLDLDHFKQVNDTYGHLVGDEVLRAAADRLRGAVRLADTVGRTGGEEFTAILCDLAHNEDAERIAALIVHSMRQPLSLSDRELVVTVSLGVALFPDDARDAATLLRLSDEALYAAKRSGRNRAVFATQALRTT